MKKLLLMFVVMFSFAMEKDVQQQSTSSVAVATVCPLCSEIIQATDNQSTCRELCGEEGDPSHIFHDRCVIERCKSGEKTCPVCGKDFKNLKEVLVVRRTVVLNPTLLSLLLMRDLLLAGRAHESEDEDRDGLPDCHMQ